MMLPYARHRLAHRARHARSSALGGRSASSIAAPQTDRARQFASEKIALGLGLRKPCGISDRLRLSDILVDLGEASAVCIFGSGIEHLAGCLLYTSDAA